MKSNIPNTLTLLNLFCALPAIESALTYNFHLTVLWMSLSLVFDFLDGAVARWLGVSSPLGIQLDSLADVVSFGVVPSFVLYRLMHTFVPPGHVWLEYAPYISFLIAMGAAYRLARFNLDTSQTLDFKGLPTPSAAIFTMGLPFVIEFFGRTHFKLIYLLPLPIILFWVMNSEIRLFSLKYKKQDSYLWLKSAFLISALLILGIFKLAGLSFVILLYVVLSILFYNSEKNKKNEISS